MPIYSKDMVLIERTYDTRDMNDGRVAQFRRAGSHKDLNNIVNWGVDPARVKDYHPIEILPGMLPSGMTAPVGMNYRGGVFSTPAPISYAQDMALIRRASAGSAEGTVEKIRPAGLYNSDLSDPASWGKGAEAAKYHVVPIPDRRFGRPHEVKPGWHYAGGKKFSPKAPGPSKMAKVGAAAAAVGGVVNTVRYHWKKCTTLVAGLFVLFAYSQGTENNKLKNGAPETAAASAAAAPGGQASEGTHFRENQSVVCLDAEGRAFPAVMATEKNVAAGAACGILEDDKASCSLEEARARHFASITVKEKFGLVDPQYIFNGIESDSPEGADFAVRMLEDELRILYAGGDTVRDEGIDRPYVFDMVGKLAGAFTTATGSPSLSRPLLKASITEALRLGTRGWTAADDAAPRGSYEQKVRAGAKALLGTVQEGLRRVTCERAEGPASTP